MAKRSPAFHARQHLVYHTNYSCPHALRLLPTDRLAGQGQGVECLRCQQLNRSLGPGRSWLGRLQGWLKRKAGR